MSVRVDRASRRSRPAQKIVRGARQKAQPLIFEPQHKNIATLIFFLVTIFLGLGAGWLAGSVLSSTFKPTPVIEDAQTSQPASLNSASNDPIAEATARPQNIEEWNNKEAAKRSVQRRANLRRAYVTVQGRESIPVAVITGGSDSGKQKPQLENETGCFARSSPFRLTSITSR